MLAYPRAMAPDPDDRTLMERYRGGDLAAFDQLYRRHKDPLFRYLLRLGYRRDVAEEVFQEAWSKVVNARDAYRPSAQFRTYLFHVARNCFVDYLRRNRRHEQPSADDPDRQAAQGSDPEILAEREILRRRLDRALATLPSEQRDAWLLYEEAGLGPEQVATITGVNRETAKSRIRYATKKLRQALESASAADVPAPSGLREAGAP